MDIDDLKLSFIYIQFERINREKNERRYYYLGWEPTLFDEGAIVRRYGRIGGQQRAMAPIPYPSLDLAWPDIRAIIRRRLRNGYKIVGPDDVLRFRRSQPETDGFDEKRPWSSFRPNLECRLSAPIVSSGN